MTTVVLAILMLFAAVVLVGVLWSLIAAMRVESANEQLRRDGVQVWDQFRRDTGPAPQPASTTPVVAE